MSRGRCKQCQGQGKILKPMLDGQPVDLRHVNGSRGKVELIRVECPDCKGTGERA